LRWNKLKSDGIDVLEKAAFQHRDMVGLDLRDNPGFK
jgi:hypothetical protein